MTDHSTDASGPHARSAPRPAGSPPPEHHAFVDPEILDPEIDEVPAADPTLIASARGLFVLGLLLVLIGLNLRTLFSSFAAVLTEIRADTGMSVLVVTLLTSVPVLLLGLFAPVAPLLARRFGAERVILGAMVLLTLGLATRGLGLLPAMLIGTAVSGASIAIVNVLLPGLVKRNFHHRLGLMSGLYTMSICASAALGAGLTHPLFDATGSWQFALLAWTIPAGAMVLLWTPIAVRQKHVRRATVADGPSVWKSSTAWQITIFMVLQAMMSFSVFAWLAPILRERGIDGGTAGLIVSVSIVLQMAGSLAAPALAVRMPDQRVINLVLALMASGGFALSIFGPLSIEVGGAGSGSAGSVQLIWVWTGLLGLGQGGLTAVALTMIILRTRDAHAAAHLSGMMQGVGYGLGSSGTLLVGQLHAVTGTFTAAGVMFLVIGVLAAFFGYRAGRDRFVGEEHTVEEHTVEENTVEEHPVRKAKRAP
ncbi:MFS transporter [Cryobacterium melibiosiphilum]|uniref:MFS transporter n=1 Tax=Cryobacterium melibiosiphilum TaxID=995039 RepID=A0A3A5M756_9MICO|nr:MFS transporter [Cryobacterium melibiosiphilum]RJT84568.1 MFS transporter [Cryobacterium melibiosiphilum]